VTAKSYVEPVPEAFARIAALAEMTRQGLEGRGLIQLLPKNFEFDPSLGDRLGAIASLALEFKAMAEKELQGQPLSEEDAAIISSFGDTLEEVVLWVTGEKLEQDPAAIIADVATDPNKGEVLEVGIGNVHELYVVAPIPQADGSLALTVARGGIFSYYEFPSQERLTDEAWIEKVKEGTAPDQPAFSSGFTVEQAASPDVQAAIYRFQRDWANWLYWTVGYSGEDGCPVSPEFRVPVDQAVLDKAQKAIAALREQNQYEGRQWIQSDYLSVEPSVDDPQNLIVTVRETWSDYLVIYSGSDPFTWYGVDAEPISARRGPYTVDVAYELEPLDEECRPGATCYAWRIVGFEELTERPGWGSP
jgi:hypothetical protein